MGLFSAADGVSYVPPEIDKDAFEYGGKKGQAELAANRQTALGDQADARANAQYQQGQGARADQAQVANLMMRRARGEVPSIAQMQADRQMQQAAASQSSMAANARGAAGLALAQQNAAGNTANAQGAISNQAQINAAQERMQAENAAYGAMSNMRGQDLAAQGQDQNYALMRAKMAQDINRTQMAGQMARESLRSSNELNTNSLNEGHDARMSNEGYRDIGMILGAGEGAMKMAAMAKGGHANAGTPYLVGEEGPELVLPVKDGVVLPAGPTKTILSILQASKRARADGGMMNGLSGLGDSATAAEAPETFAPPAAPATAPESAPAPSSEPQAPATPGPDTGAMKKNLYQAQFQRDQAQDQLAAALKANSATPTKAAKPGKMETMLGSVRSAMAATPPSAPAPMHFVQPVYPQLPALAKGGVMEGSSDIGETTYKLKDGVAPWNAPHSFANETEWNKYFEKSSPQKGAVSIAKVDLFPAGAKGPNGILFSPEEAQNGSDDKTKTSWQGRAKGGRVRGMTPAQAVKLANRLTGKGC